MSLNSRCLASEKGGVRLPSEYIVGQDFQNLMEDLIQKIDSGSTAEVKQYLEQLLADSRTQERYIDRTYMSRLKDQRRKSKITEITSLLLNMNDEQLENIRVYTPDEYAEPNHEATALSAVIQLSREQGKLVK